MSVSLKEIRDGQCRFPLSKEPQPVEKLRFCGKPCEGDRAWCSAHAKIVYIPDKPRPPRAPRK